MAQGDPMKWHMPGWRIEQRYAPGVLIGNWGEERHAFKKGAQANNSTYRQDFVNCDGHRPDVILRRKAELQNEGLGKEFLFYHHGNRYSNNMISWYDEHYNKRERDEKNKLPEMRHWDGHAMAWVPEKTDYPIQGEPTNFGLNKNRAADWQQQIADETHGDYNTTYHTSYNKFPGSAIVHTRYATPQEQSTTLHRFNKVNKNLPLREKLDKPGLQSPQIV